MNNIDLKLKSLKQQIKTIDLEIDKSIEKSDKIQLNRKSKGYSLAVYKCTDAEAIEVVELDSKIKQLEINQDNLRSEHMKLYMEKYKEESLLYHAKFKDNRYEIIYNNDVENKIYTNDKDYYINKSLSEKVDISVFEYINYNKTLNSNVNKPILRTLYNHDISKDNYFNADVHQDGYSNYRETYTDSKGNIKQLIEYGYNNQNEEIYSRMINIFGDEFISLHKPFSSGSYVVVSKMRNSNTYYMTRGTLSHSKFTELSTEVRELFNDILYKLSRYKDYKYDVEYIKEFMGV